MDKAAFSDSAAIGIGIDRKPGGTFADSVQMCSKCNRKLDEGKTLRKSVKAAIKDGYGEQVKLEKVDCFSLCPRGGQVLSTTDAGGKRRLVIVQPDSDVEIAVAYLLRDAGA